MQWPDIPVITNQVITRNYWFGSRNKIIDHPNLPTIFHGIESKKSDGLYEWYPNLGIIHSFNKPKTTDTFYLFFYPETGKWIALANQKTVTLQYTTNKTH